MALELVAGAALGTVFAALYDAVNVALGRTVMQFKPHLKNLKLTLDFLRPRIIEQIREQNVALNLPNEEIDRLRLQMEEGTELVDELSKLSMWNCSIWCSCCNCTKPSYTDKLVELDGRLRGQLVILNLQQMRDGKEGLDLMRKIIDKQDELDKKLSDIQKVLQEARLRPHEEWNGWEVSGSNNSQPTGKKRIEGNDVQRTALGAAFGVLFGAVIQVKDKTKMFKRILGYLKSTLDSLKPLIEEITEYNKVLHLPKEELENFTIQMEKGVELIHKCSKVHKSANYKKYEYTNKLLRLDESLQGLLSILKVQLARNARESLVFVSNTEAVIKQIQGSDMVQNDQIESKGSCAVHEPTLATVGLDVLNVQGIHDVIMETLVSTKNMEEGVKLVEGSSVVQLPNAQIEIKGSCEMVEPPSPAIALKVQNVHETMNVKETLDSAKSMDAGVKLVEGSGVVQNQINIGVTEPSSPTVGFDVMNMQGTRDEKETLVSVGEVADKQTEGTEVVELEAAAAQSELPSFAVGLDVLLMELKRKFLTDEVPALVIPGPEGCGKTTLAKQFCQDEEVKDSPYYLKPLNDESRVTTSQKYGLTQVVLKMERVDRKTTERVKRKVSGLDGVDSISLDLKNQQLKVAGREMDVMRMVRMVRKIVAVDITSVGPLEVTQLQGHHSNQGTAAAAVVAGQPVLEKRLSHVVSMGANGASLEEFSLEELLEATSNFSEEHKIGTGSNGSVYYARLTDGRQVAIKRAETSASSYVGGHTRRQEDKDNAFVNELKFLSRINHKNLVRLLGFFEDTKERILVYEYMNNATLHDHLHNLPHSPLVSWAARINVALDAARGVEYLHMYAVPPVIHRDIKSSNILLDDTLRAKVSDFGLSLMGPEDNQSHLSLRAAGTFGYMDPEYYLLQQMTTKSDVYSFGVVLLELLSGYNAIHKNENGVPRNVVDFVVPYIVNDEIHRILDPKMPDPNPFEIEAMAYVGYLAADCVSLEGKDRPSMTDIVSSLERALSFCLANVSRSPSKTGSFGSASSQNA